MRFIYLGLIFLLILSCKKTNKITLIEGIIVESGNKQPLDSVTVHIQDGIGSGEFGPTTGNGQNFYTITNKDGHFSIKVEGEAPALEITKSNYSWEYSTGGSSQRFKFYTAGQTYKNEYFEMNAEAKFQPILKSIDISTILDTVKFLDGIFYPLNADFEQYGSSTSGKFYGKGPFKLYEYLAMPAIGDKYRYFKIGLWRNGIARVRIDSVFVKSFTTFTDTIYY